MFAEMQTSKTKWQKKRTIPRFSHGPRKSKGKIENQTICPRTYCLGKAQGVGTVGVRECMNNARSQGSEFTKTQTICISSAKKRTKQKQKNASTETD